MTPPAKTPAHYTWLDPDAPETATPRRVDWCLFRRRFTLDRAAAAASLHLFASTRYRLRVNGRIIGAGPARFVPGHETFDTFDLSSDLVVGGNVLLVEACFIDANNYQSMPGDHGRFIAWGEIQTSGGERIDFSTPGGWQARRSLARDDGAPAFSFAIGPGEVLDREIQRREIDGSTGWTTPRVLPDAAGVSPRDLAVPTGEILTPTLRWAAPLVDDERVFGFVSLRPPSASDHDATKPRDLSERFRYATFLHSPRDQTLTLGLHWGPHFLNGLEVAGGNDPVRGNRQNASVTLRRGWNLLCGEVAQLQPAYPFLLGLPRASGVTAHATPDVDDDRPIRHQPPRRIADGESWTRRPPVDADDLNRGGDAGGGWHFADAEGRPPCPARIMSWDRPDPSARVTDPALPLRFGPGRAWTGLADFGGEYLGHVRVDINAPAGTVVDLAYDERLRSDGCLDLFFCNPFVETADRFVCAGGRESFETFHPRGGRYVQVTVRPPDPAADAATLHGLTVRDARCLVPVTGDFNCDRDIFNWAWEHGIASMQAGTEDTFCDSPWRERGTYLGDSYVQSLVHLGLSADHRIARQALRLFADGQRDDGQFPCVVPAWLRAPHGDFTLIYALWLRDYWARTGDLDTVRHGLPAVGRALASPTWQTSRYSVLWDATEQNRLFIDWGVLKELRTYEENATLNALRAAALRAAAEMHRAVGDAAPAEQHAAEADAVAEAFRARLWLADVGRFAPGTADGTPIPHDALHPNLLALAFGLADAEREPALAAHVVQRLLGNAAHAASGDRHGDFAELYFLKFALDALVRIERYDVAEKVIADHMQVMRDHGAWTFWECLHRGVRKDGSLCHSWSAAPLEYFSRTVLGVREATPGEPETLRIAPRSATLGRVSGVFPHPRGPVNVSWTRTPDGQFDVNAHGPAGVKLILP